MGYKMNMCLHGTCRFAFPVVLRVPWSASIYVGRAQELLHGLHHAPNDDGNSTGEEGANSSTVGVCFFDRTMSRRAVS